MNDSFLGNMIYSISSAAVVGFIFWAFLSSKFASLANIIEGNKILFETKIAYNQAIINELRIRIVALETERIDYMTTTSFREEKSELSDDLIKIETRLERKIDTLDGKIETIHCTMIEMPATILKLIKENK